jgi:hypothetical protein
MPNTLSASRVDVQMFPGFVSVRAGDREVTRYHFAGTWKPYFWPLMGPCGNVVRGASGEHQHQAGLFLAYGGHGSESGPTNIWSDWDEPPYGVCGKMLHMGFDRVTGGEDGARMVERVLYVNGQGEAILEEVRDMQISMCADGGCLIDWRRTVPVPNEPNGGPFMLSGRVCDALRARDNRSRGEDGKWMLIEGGGQMCNAQGDVSRDERFQGQEWVDFSGVCDSGRQGIALFDHPDNPGFPGQANASAYGPIGLAHRHPGLDGGPNVVTFRYGIYVHPGNAEEGRVDVHYRAFCEA